MGTHKTQPQPERQRPAFDLGTTRVTCGVHETVSAEEIFRSLSRHRRGDWGVLDPEDRESNERALRTGGRLFSAYQLDDGRKVWVITEAEDDDGRRSATTVLLPDEY